MSKKLDKAYEQRKQMVEGLNSLDEAIIAVEGLAKSYDAHIDEAILLHEQAYSDQLIADKVELVAFAGDLKFLKLQLKNHVITANALGNLASLPKVMNNCQSALSTAPNLAKLGKDMAKFQKSMDRAKTTLKTFREAFQKTKNPELVGLLPSMTQNDPKIAELIAKEKEQREIRLMARVNNPKTNPTPVAADVHNGLESDDPDIYTRAIEESRRDDD